MQYGGHITGLPHKRQEMHGRIISTVATAALVLKHQAISSHSADEIFIVPDQFHTKILYLLQKHLRIKSHFEIIYPVV